MHTQTRPVVNEIIVADKKIETVVLLQRVNQPHCLHASMPALPLIVYLGLTCIPIHT